MLDIKFDTAGQKYINKESVYEKHKEILSRINLEGRLIAEVIRSARK